MNLEKLFLGGLAAFLVFLSALMVLPFIGYLIAAFILAYILKPLQRRIEPTLGPILSTLLVMILFVGAVLAPFAMAVGAVIDDATQLIDELGDIETIDFSELEQTVFNLTGLEMDLEQEITEGLERFTDIAFGGIAQVLDFITGLALGLLIMMFVLFYLIKDGDRLYLWLREVTPVNDERQESLYSKAGIMTTSILKGHVLVAVIEGLIGGLGLLIAGVPNTAFWTFVMILMSFIPIIGPFLVWAPASAYLILVGEPIAGLFLIVYGVAVISPADNLLRPYLVDKKAEIHPATVLIGVIGGVYVFGAVGLFIGPIIIGFCKTVLEVIAEEY